MKTHVSENGQITLPATVRRQDRIEAGQEFGFERMDRGRYQLVRRDPRPNEGLVDWLLACPEKGFFAPIESESTEAPARTLVRSRCRPAAMRNVGCSDGLKMGQAAG